MDNILQLFNEHSRKLATIISIILIVFMSLTVANVVLFVLETDNQSVATPDAPRAPSGNSVKTPVTKVSSLNLFGKVEAVNTAPRVIDAPETKLNLELQGVFISEDEQLSTAIVGEKNKAGELYNIGDKLPGNATLAAVYVDHVLLRRGTRMEKLMFSDSKFRVAQSDSSGRDSARATINRPTTSTTRSNLERIRDRIRNRGDSAEDTNRQSAPGNQALSEFQERLKGDPAGTLGEAGIAAVSEGESKGYRVGDNADGAIRQAGLQAGDVILSVNGRPVGVARNDSALIDQVMASSRVRVEVQRGSRRFFLTVPIPK